jgi:hypothetical protein
MDVVTEKSAFTPLWEYLGAKYDPARELIREQNYSKERKMANFSKKRKPAKIRNV